MGNAAGMLRIGGRDGCVPSYIPSLDLGNGQSRSCRRGCFDPAVAFRPGRQRVHQNGLRPGCHTGHDWNLHIRIHVYRDSKLRYNYTHLRSEFPSPGML